MPINITHCSFRLRSHSAAILCEKIEFLLFRVLRVAEGYVHAHPSSWSLWFLLAHLFHTCSSVNKQTSASMQLLIKLEPLIFIKSGLGLSSFYYMQWMKALRKERRKKWIDNHFSKSCLRVFLLRNNQRAIEWEETTAQTNFAEWCSAGLRVFDLRSTGAGTFFTPQRTGIAPRTICQEVLIFSSLLSNAMAWPLSFY